MELKQRRKERYAVYFQMIKLLTQLTVNTKGNFEEIDHTEKCNNNLPEISCTCVP